MRICAYSHVSSRDESVRDADVTDDSRLKIEKLSLYLNGPIFFY